MAKTDGSGVLRPKPKLPRKRKKACIAAQGRPSYLSTVSLAKQERDTRCRFWVNATVRYIPTDVNGVVVPIPAPQSFW